MSEEVIEDADKYWRFCIRCPKEGAEAFLWDESGQLYVCMIVDGATWKQEIRSDNKFVSRVDNIVDALRKGTDTGLWKRVP